MAELHYNNGDAISAAVLAGLGTYVVIEASRWDYMAPDGPGPGFFPIWYGLALVVLSLFVIGARVARLARDGRDAPPTPAQRAARRRGIYNALGVWLAFTITIALLQPLGFMIAFGLLTFFIVSLIYGQRLKVALAVAVLTSLGFWLVFPLALGVELPVGIFGF